MQHRFDSAEKARLVATLLIFAFAVYIAHDVMAAVLWSCLIAVSVWPLRERIGVGRSLSPTASALIFATAAALLLLMPIAYLVYHGFREVPALLRVWGESQDSGLPAPDWLGRLPLVGDWASRTWATWIAEPGALSTVVHGFVQKLRFSTGRTLVADLGHRAMSIFFCVLTLFFLIRDGDRLAQQIEAVTLARLGAPAVRTLRTALRATRSTVNGLVLVGLGLAVVMGIAYAVADVPHAAFWGLLTGLLGLVPFGAAVAAAGVSAYLLAVGATHAAIALFLFAALLIFVSDHFIRPLFISGAAHVPLLLSLIGIVGGLETLGLLGLFVGPTVMAVMVTVWRQIAASGERRAARLHPPRQP